MLFCKSKCWNVLKGLLPILVTVSVILLFHFTNSIYFKCYPAVMNFLFFAIFFSSLFAKETVIQKMARLMEPDIKPAALLYTRRLTYVWSGIMFGNFCVSLYSIFASHKFWMFYNGFLSYFLIGTVFVVEYGIRIWFKRKYDC